MVAARDARREARLDEYSGGRRRAKADDSLLSFSLATLLGYPRSILIKMTRLRVLLTLNAETNTICSILRIKVRLVYRSFLTKSKIFSSILVIMHRGDLELT